MCILNDDCKHKESLLNGDISFETVELCHNANYEDECFIMGSKHYDTIETRIRLDIYNAYDDKGNKIEGDYITLMKKEYDNIE